jgi:hypothetical protein
MERAHTGRWEPMKVSDAGQFFYVSTPALFGLRWVEDANNASMDLMLRLVGDFIAGERARCLVVVVGGEVGPPSAREGGGGRMAALNDALLQRGIFTGILFLGDGYLASLAVGFASAGMMVSKKLRHIVIARSPAALFAKVPPDVDLSTLERCLADLEAAAVARRGGPQRQAPAGAAPR